MSVPLSDTRLTLRAEILAALSAAGAFCGECGFEPGETGCADCVRVRDLYADAVMPIVDRLSALVATEPAQPSPEHQAIYLDDFDQVWCDYPTIPAGDDVLPLVWASEQAQSRADLADGGNRLRVIGWCR